jgi:hypothetical protein
MMLSPHMARNKGKAFDALGDELKRGLGTYGIDGKKWDLIRTLAIKGPDGREYISPEGIQALSDDAIKKAFGKPKAREREIRRLKDQLETSLRSYFVDRTDYAILTPGAAERAYLKLGTQAGTPLGEAIRMVMQFKAFPATMISKGLGRAVYGKGADTLWQAFRHGKADFVGLAHLMVATTGMGYLAMAAKDIVKGKTPRDPKDPHTWAAAFTQGGGAGIMGDFIFGEFNRFGSSFLSSMAGPAAGQIESVAELYAKFRDGDDVAARTVKLLINNTPFINLAYTRPAMDYLFLYAVQEHLNPGYLKRMEKRIERENRQTFLFPPSRYAIK